MSTKRRRKQTAALSLLQLPDSYLHQFIHYLTPDSKLSLRATCKALLHAVDGAPVHSTGEGSTSSPPPEPCSSCSEAQTAYSGLRLRVITRKPSLSALHNLHLLHNVVVLATQTASRGAISIGCTDPAQQLANGLPRLKLAVITNSQASLVELLVHAAPQLRRIQLSLTSNAPKVVGQLSQLSDLCSLEITLDHAAWMKGCAELSELTQLQHLAIAGKPLDETSKHGVASISSVFWENNIACLSGLTSLHVNPWIKASPDAGSSVTYSTLRNLRQLHVPYCSGKLGPGATSALLSQLSCCSSLTSLTLGVHEFNWDVSHLSHLTQLRELEIHNPFLKEVWGLQPFTAAALTPLTAATSLTSLTLSHLRLPLLQDTMAIAGQGVAAVAAQPGAAAALADALAAGDGPAADIVHAIAATAVAHVLRGAAAGSAAGAAAVDAHHDSMRAVWWAVADTLQQQAAAAVASAARQLPAAYGARAAAAAAAAAAATAAGTVSPAALLTGVQFPSTAAVAADGSGPPSPSGTVTSSAGTPGVPPEMLALAHEVIAAMAKHTAVRLQQQQHQQLQQQTPDTSRVSDVLLQQYLRAAHGMAASVGPVVAAAAAAGAAMPTGQLPTYMATLPPPAQALAAAHLAAQVAGGGGGGGGGGGNPLAAAALAGPQLGFVAVPAVPPPLLPPPPPPPIPGAQAVAAAAVPAVGIPATLPAAGLAAVSAAAADAAAVAAAAAAKASASMIFDQVPVLPSLKRLTVGTTHGRLMSGVQIAALAPSLTCLEDLSELPRVPTVTSDILGGLNQLELLTVNVDTLQLYARHASLTGLRALDKLGHSSDAGSAAVGASKASKAGTAAAAGRQLRSSSAAAGGAAGSKKGKNSSSKAAAGAGKAAKAKVSARGSRAAQKQAAAAAAASAAAVAADIPEHVPDPAVDKDIAGPVAAPSAAAADPAAQAAADAPVAAAEATAAEATAAGADVLPSTPAAAVAPAASVSDGPLSSASSGRSAVSKYDLLHLGSSWRQLSNLRCLRLLMLGHLQPPDAFADVRVLPTLPGVTRLELCSAFGGSLDYADTYTIAEDPYLWQEQVYVEELVIDGGVLLGGFMVNATMAKLLKEKLVRLEKLVLCRCLDLTVEHLETAMQQRLAPLIVVKRDCPQVTEADVVDMNQEYGWYGVRVVLEPVGPTDYVSKSFTYAIDD